MSCNCCAMCCLNDPYMESLSVVGAVRGHPGNLGTGILPILERAGGKGKGRGVFTSPRGGRRA